MYLLSTTGFQSRYQDIAAQPGGTLVFSRVEDFPHNFVDGRGMGCRLMPHQSDLDRPDSAARDVASVYHNLYDGVPVSKNELPPTSLISQFVCQHRDSISLLAGYRNEYDEWGCASPEDAHLAIIQAIISYCQATLQQSRRGMPAQIRPGHPAPWHSDQS